MSVTTIQLATYIKHMLHVAAEGIVPSQELNGGVANALTIMISLLKDCENFKKLHDRPMQLGALYKFESGSVYMLVQDPRKGSDLVAICVKAVEGQIRIGETLGAPPGEPLGTTPSSFIGYFTPI